MRHPTLPRSRRTIALLAATATAATGGAIAAVTIANAATTGCSATYSVTSQWSTGFTANVSVTNLGDALTSWTVAWDFAAGQTVTQSWNGSFAQSDTTVTITNAGYNGSVAANGSLAFGFNGTWTGSNPSPSSFALNDVTCTGSTTGTASAVASASTTTTASATPTASASASPSTPGSTVNGRQIESLGRGVVSVRSGSGNLVTWRLLAHGLRRMSVQRLPGRDEGQLLADHRLDELPRLRGGGERDVHGAGRRQRHGAGGVRRRR